MAESQLGPPVEAWLPISVGSPFFLNQKGPINTSPLGPFRDMVLEFILRWAEHMEYAVEGMSVSVIYLRHKKNIEAYIPLYVLEEDVKHSKKPFCDYCGTPGWGGRFLAKKNYHFIIPTTYEWDNPPDEGIFDLQTHLLHGFIHSDGYGHLIRINGIEGGSQFITGREIMDFWDFICTSLHVRQISVSDLSRKDGMDLRLLHGISYGNSWFSEWGYDFCHGSFGSNKDDYVRAMAVLNSLELDKISYDFSLKKQGKTIRQIIDIYRVMCNNKLTTIGDLFRFMLEILPTERRSEEHSSEYSCTKGPRYREFSDIARNTCSQWDFFMHESLASCIAEYLITKGVTNGNGWMTAQDIRDKMNEIDSEHPGLMDHVLKAMNNVIVEIPVGDSRKKYIVRRKVNKLRKTQEYTVYDFKGGSTEDPDIFPGRCVRDDIIYLYKSVLCGYPDPTGQSVKEIIKSKNFVKKFPLIVEDDNTSKFVCWVASSEPVFNGVSLGEFTVARLVNLKTAVQTEMRENYFVAECVTVSGVEDISWSVDKKVRCRGMNLRTELRFQGGTTTKKFNCKCGANQDDGERMMMCRECQVWCHTLCLGIEDEYPMLEMFVCDQCEPYVPRVCKSWSDDDDMDS